MEPKDTRLTTLPNGACVQKNSPEIEFFGKIDETIAALSLAKSHIENQKLEEEKDFIGDVQAALMLLPNIFKDGAELSPKFYEQLGIVDERIAFLETQFSYPNKFIVGQTREESFMHFARASVRALERSFCQFSDNMAAAAYLNRLSSYLFALCVIMQDDAA